MSAPNFSAMLGAQPAPDLSEAETRLLDTRRPEPARPPPVPPPPARTQGTPSPVPKTLPPSIERAATPTVRELFYQGELLDRDTPGPGQARPAAEDPRARPRRGNLVLMMLAAVVVAAMSFIVAATLLGRDRDGLAGPDAGAGAIAPDDTEASPADQPAPTGPDAPGTTE
jgi:hypothetical protein